MIYTIGGIKGGSSKTTIATNLVVFLLQQKRKVLLVDADDQASAASFTDVRSQLHDAVGYEMQQLTGRTLHQQVFALAGEYDDIVIDTGGRDTVSQRAALTVSDVFLVPFAPRSLDIWTIDAVVKLVDEVKSVNANLRSFSFVSRTDVHGNQGSAWREAAAVLKEYPSIEFLDQVVGNRVAFGNAVGRGEGVLELKPADAKASAEITKLFTHIQQLTK